MIELSSLIENCPSALLDVSLKALALGLCASLVLAVGRVKSPALRHAVWGNVLHGMLVLPLLGPLLPAIPLPVPPGAPGKARVVADQSSWEKPSSAGAPSVDGHNAVSRVAPYEWEPGAQPNAPPNPVKGALPAGALRGAWPAVIAEEDPVGKSVKVGTDYYTVVGVVKQANDLKDNVYMPLMTSMLRFGERIIDNRAGRVEAVETQLSRLILEVRDGADVEATAALVKRTLEPHHPEGDVEVVILKPDRETK